MNPTNRFFAYIGGFIIWLLKGMKTKLIDEMPNSSSDYKFYRNTIFALVLMFLILIIIHFFYNMLK
jgi:uncharacterized Tic20 family protein